MGSSYYGEPNMGTDRAVATGAGSRRSKKGSSEKPKQPQRGLGVAQLEKIRLTGQIGGSGSTSYGQFGHRHQYPSATYQGLAYSPEDIRGQTAYSSIPSSSFSYASSSPSSASYGFNSNFMMGMGSGDYERGSIRYGDNSSHQSSAHMSWGTSHGYLEMPQPATTRPLLNLQEPHTELGFEMNDAQELDLELRLSL